MQIVHVPNYEFIGFKKPVASVPSGRIRTKKKKFCKICNTKVDTPLSLHYKIEHNMFYCRSCERYVLRPIKRHLKVMHNIEQFIKPEKTITRGKLRKILRSRLIVL